MLQEAVKNTEYDRLRDGRGKAPGLLGWWPDCACTFVDNHDTGSTQQVGRGVGGWVSGWVGRGGWVGGELWYCGSMPPCKGAWFAAWQLSLHARVSRACQSTPAHRPASHLHLNCTCSTGPSPAPT